MDLLVFLLVGAVAGWLAGTLMKGTGFGLVGNIIVGLIGGLLGGWLLGNLHISIGSGIVNQIVTALAGAVILIVILRAVKK